MSEEVESPRRAMPIALVGGVALVTVIYVLVTVTFVLAAPAGRARDATKRLWPLLVPRFWTWCGTRALARWSWSRYPAAWALCCSVRREPTWRWPATACCRLRLTWFDARRGSSPVERSCRSISPARWSCSARSTRSSATLFRRPCSSSGSPRHHCFVSSAPPMTDDVFRAPLYPLPLIVFLSLIAVMLVLFVVGQPTETSLGAFVVLLGLLVSRFVI